MEPESAPEYQMTQSQCLGQWVLQANKGLVRSSGSSTREEEAYQHSRRNNIGCSFAPHCRETDRVARGRCGSLNLTIGNLGDNTSTTLSRSGSLTRTRAGRGSKTVWARGS